MAKKTDSAANMAETMTKAVSAAQAQMQNVFTEIAELTKGNVEAMAQSGKILTDGIQAMGKGAADEAKTAYETASADVNAMASVKSPSEFFQLQGEIMRRNFETMFAATSKNSDVVTKLAGEASAPISSRAQLAAETLSKVA